MKVIKFGGSTLKDAADINRVAEVVKNDQDEKIVDSTYSCLRTGVGSSQ